MGSPETEPTITKVSADERGEIYSISLPGDREIMLLHSFKGTLRGGHSHSCDEVVLLLSGKLWYTRRTPEGEEWTSVVAAGECSFNPAGIVHLGEFLGDSWLIEWKIGTTKEGWSNENYAPYRNKVLAQLR